MEQHTKTVPTDNDFYLFFVKYDVNVLSAVLKVALECFFFFRKSVFCRLNTTRLFYWRIYFKTKALEHYEVRRRQAALIFITLHSRAASWLTSVLFRTSPPPTDVIPGWGLRIRCAEVGLPCVNKIMRTTCRTCHQWRHPMAYIINRGIIWCISTMVAYYGPYHQRHITSWNMQCVTNGTIFNQAHVRW